MSKKQDKTVLLSDRYISESGVQGGKIIGEQIMLFSFVLGIPFFIVGLCMLVGLGFPAGLPIVIGGLLLFVIGLLLIIGGYFMYKDKRLKK